MLIVILLSDDDCFEQYECHKYLTGKEDLIYGERSSK